MSSFLLAAAVLLAGTPPQPSPSPAAVPSPKDRARQAAPSQPDRLYLAGILRAIDVDAKAITFDDEQGKRYVWPVNAALAENAPARAEQMLASLKPGQKVWITYDLDPQGQPRSILELRPWTPPRPRDQRRPTTPAPPAPPQ